MGSGSRDIPSETALDCAQGRLVANGTAASKNPAELRQSERAVLYWWQRVAQHGPWPPLASFDLERMSARDWGHRFLISSHSSFGGYAFLVYGRRVARLLDLPDEPVPEVTMVKQLPERYLPIFVDGCNEAAAGRGPIRKAGALEQPDGMVELYRAVFLPVGFEPAREPYIYGAFNSRVLRKPQRIGSV